MGPVPYSALRVPVPPLPSPVPQPRSQQPRDTLIPPERPGVLTLVTHMARHFVSTQRTRGHTHTHSHLERCSQAGRQMGRATVNSRATEQLGRSWGGEGRQEDRGGSPGPWHCPAGATGQQGLLAAGTRSDRVSPRQRPGVSGLRRLGPQERQRAPHPLPLFCKRPGSHTWALPLGSGPTLQGWSQPHTDPAGLGYGGGCPSPSERRW